MITDMDEVLTPFARERGIGLINAAGLHMGILTQEGAPPGTRRLHRFIQAGAPGSRFVPQAWCRYFEVAIRFSLDLLTCRAHWLASPVKRR